MITSNITFRELFAKSQVKDFVKFITGNCYIPDLDISLKEMQKQFPDWDAESIAAGLNRFFDLLDAGVNTVYD